MTERGLPLADGAPACPFVAFEDDRDERASVPDHRHRCYAEARPAPRALAHQEAYCLSSAFPVCPTFQDWARREAARSRGGAATAPEASADMNREATNAASDATAGSDAAAPSALGAGAAAVGALGVTGTGGGPDAPSSQDDDDASDDHPSDDLARRNPPRDWAAPPPWLASAERPRTVDADPPSFLGRRATEPGQGLAGSPADRLAGGPPPERHDEPDDEVWSSDSRSAAATGAGLTASPASAPATPSRRAAPPPDDDGDGNDEEDRRPARRSRA